jgi:hypothetical protein
MPLPLGLVGAVPPPQFFMMPPAMLPQQQLKPFGFIDAFSPSNFLSRIMMMPPVVMPQPSPAPLAPMNQMVGQPCCPGQCVARLPAPDAMPQANGRLAQYELEMWLVDTTSDARRILAHHTLHLSEGTTGRIICQDPRQEPTSATETSEGQGSTIIECHVQAPAQSGRARVLVNAERINLACDRRHTHHTTLDTTVSSFDGVQRMVLDTAHGGKTQRSLEFLVRQVDPEPLPLPNMCVSNNVVQCQPAPAPLPAPAYNVANLVQCSGTGSVYECPAHSWTFQCSGEGDEHCLAASKDESEVTCKDMKLKMADGSVLQLDSCDEGHVTIVSQSLHGQAARVHIAPSMDKVVLEGPLQLTYGKNNIELDEGSAVWTVKDGTVECRVAKVPE